MEMETGKKRNGVKSGERTVSDRGILFAVSLLPTLLVLAILSVFWPESQIHFWWIAPLLYGAFFCATFALSVFLFVIAIVDLFFEIFFQLPPTDLLHWAKPWKWEVWKKMIWWRHRVKKGNEG